MPPVSARRAKIQERKAQQQLLLALVAAIGLGIIFVFFLMPMLFSFVISIARKGQPVKQEQGDVIPPQKPVIQPPPEFQNSKELQLTGYTEPRANVQLYFDSAQTDIVPANDDGQFTFLMQLEEGQHEIWVTAADEAGNVSAESEHYQVTADVTVPKIESLQPEDGASFSLPRERTQSVKGKVSESAQVKVNGALTQTDADGNFSVTIQLAEGLNEIAVVATDPAGNVSEEKKITVQYHP